MNIACHTHVLGHSVKNAISEPFFYCIANPSMYSFEQTHFQPRIIITQENRNRSLIHTTTSASTFPPPFRPLRLQVQQQLLLLLLLLLIMRTNLFYFTTTSSATPW